MANEAVSHQEATVQAQAKEADSAQVTMMKLVKRQTKLDNR